MQNFCSKGYLTSFEFWFFNHSWFTAHVICPTSELLVDRRSSWNDLKIFPWFIEGYIWEWEYSCILPVINQHHHGICVAAVCVWLQWAYLRWIRVRWTTSRSPHLLKLNSDFRKRFYDYGNENILKDTIRHLSAQTTCKCTSYAQTQTRLVLNWILFRFLLYDRVNRKIL